MSNYIDVVQEIGKCLKHSGQTKTDHATTQNSRLSIDLLRKFSFKVAIFLNYHKNDKFLKLQQCYYSFLKIH